MQKFKMQVIFLMSALMMCIIFVEVAMSETKSPNWVKVVENAEWAPRDSCGEVVFKDKMWLLAGWFTSNEPGPRDVWSSADGVKWDLVTPEAPWLHGDLPTTVVYKDRMWIMGGWYGGRKPFGSASNQVWSSADGANWEQATASAGWCPRLGAGGVVFDGKMWIIGGVERYFDSEPHHLLNDVWYTTDGKNWTLATKNAPWGARAFHAVLAFDNKLWVFAGGNYLNAYLGYDDVWSSPDGVNWTQVTEHAPWSHRIWFSSVVYKDRMWLFGGWSNNPSLNWNDVWYSSDGANWKQLKTETIWSERHEQSFYVFKDKIWLVGGNAWPLVNDVWQLEVSDEWLKEH